MSDFSPTISASPCTIDTPYNLRKRGRDVSPIGALKRKASGPLSQQRSALRRRTSRGAVDAGLVDAAGSHREGTTLRDAAALGFSKFEVIAAFKSLQKDKIAVTLESLLTRLSELDAADTISPCAASDKSTEVTTKETTSSGNQGGDDSDTCCICLEELASKAVFTTECGHRFHFNCIKEAVQKRNVECPLCRRSFETMTPPAALPAPRALPQIALQQAGIINVLLRARQTRMAQRYAVRALVQQGVGGGHTGEDGDDSTEPFRRLVHMRVQRAIDEIRRTANNANNNGDGAQTRSALRAAVQAPVPAVATNDPASTAERANDDDDTRQLTFNETVTEHLASPGLRRLGRSGSRLTILRQAPAAQANGSGPAAAAAGVTADSGRDGEQDIVAQTPPQRTRSRSRSRSASRSSSKGPSSGSRSRPRHPWPAHTEGRLEAWSFDPERRRVTGMIADHRRYADGQIITTSKIRRARGRQVMTHSGSTYLLGEPNQLVEQPEALDIENPLSVFGYPRST